MSVSKKPVPEAPPAAAGSGAVALAATIVVGLVVVGAALYYFLTTTHHVPPSFDLVVRVVLVAGIGLLAVYAVGRVLFLGVERWAGSKHAGLIHSAYRLVAYVALALAILYSVGVNGYALLAGGTFAGLVLGLAAQSALANFVSGVVLLVARPFEPGDRITVVSSSYSFLLPSYPPKFYSQDLLMPGFTGVVQDIGFAFTTVRLDEGPSVVLPNSVVIGAAVVAHSLPERWVRVKYEVPPTVLPEVLLPKVKELVEQSEWVIRPEAARVTVNAATMTSYVVAVDAICRGNLEEPPRSDLYIGLMRLVRQLALAPPSTPNAGPSGGPAKT
jgi:small conductance mechanosensitive channel